MLGDIVVGLVVVPFKDDTLQFELNGQLFRSLNASTSLYSDLLVFKMDDFQAG